MQWQFYLQQLAQQNFLHLARCISLVENEVEGFNDFLKALPIHNVPVIGITGPPGAGKSTLTDALIAQLVAQQKKSSHIMC